MSPLVGEAPPNDTGQQNVSPRRIVDPVRLTVGIAEIELREIAVKVLLSSELIDAPHPSLEDREIAFDGVGMGGAAHILAHAVIDSGMPAEAQREGAIMVGFVGHQLG